MAEKFENSASFPRLSLPSLVHHENGAFRKHSSNRRNLETPALCFRVDRKTLRKRNLLKRFTHANHVICLPEFFFTIDLGVFRFFQGSVDGEPLKRFQSEISVF